MQLFTATALGVVAMNVGALLLVLFRSWAFHTRLYRPMVLNIALSMAPVLLLTVGGLGVLALVAAGVPAWVALVVAVVVALVWLVTLPNAGYLITELNLTHRREGDGVPEWYDVLLVLVLAMSGVLNTVVNVFLAVAVVASLVYDEVSQLADPATWGLVAVVLALVSFGIYLGRNVRINSWDVRHPASLVGKILRHLRSPGAAGNAIGFTLVATAFFGLMYLVVVGPLVAALVTTYG